MERDKENNYAANREDIYAKMLSRADEKLNLNDFPNTEICGLKAIFYLKNSEEGDIIYIDNRMARQMDMSLEDLLKAANENIANNFYIYNLKEYVPAMLRETDEDPKDSARIERNDEQNHKFLYLLMTTDGRNGAAAMLNKDILNSIYWRAGGGYYLIPSSIDELMINPSDKSDNETKLMTSWLKSTNSDKRNVSDEIFLSDNVLYYDGEELTVV